MISFDIPDSILRRREQTEQAARDLMRPVSRYYDEHEHETPWDYINAMWADMQATGHIYRSGPMPAARGDEEPGCVQETLIHVVEMLSWGDAGIYLCTPGSSLGGAAIEAVGTPEQKRKFLERFNSAQPAWACMAMTEPQAGSDTAAIRTRAAREGDEWVLNGTKIFVTGGHKSLIDSDGFVVVWATLDPGAGRAAMRPFVVEAGTPGLHVVKTENKLGIRASDTATLVLENCRIPAGNLLGGEAAEAGRGGFKGAMATFDATRPVVAASALGIARAALEVVTETLAAQGVIVPSGGPRTRLTAVQRDLLDMEAAIRAAWLLALKAAWLTDQGRPNTLEASMSKIKAGEVVTRVTQKAVELLGPLGYSRKLLVEKWMRDAKINDLFEGTGQINRLIVARRILGYSSKELK